MLTSKPIAKALVEAHQKGVQVEIILDKENFDKNSSMAKFLARAEIPLFLDGKHTAHNKIIILDGETVITGSFNFTKAADEKNAENIMCLWR